MKSCNTVFVQEIEFRHAINETLYCDIKADEGVVHVKLQQRNGVLWQGEVHVFEVSGHNNATRCYAWAEPLSETSVVIHAVLQSEKLSSARESSKISPAPRTTTLKL